MGAIVTAVRVQKKIDKELRAKFVHIVDTLEGESGLSNFNNNSRLSYQSFIAQKQIVKLLLLGSADAGKSTILKQIKIIHDNGFGVEERKERRPAVYENIITGMSAIIDGMEKLQLQYADPDVQISVHKILRTIGRNEERQKFSPAMKEALQHVWQDKVVQQEAITRGNEFQFSESCSYFLNELDRICEPNYVPSTQDILMLRNPTTGIIEAEFVIKDVRFRFIDVGGQRNERKKWIHCFDMIDVVIFVAALSEFDQTLCENHMVNRMIESMRLFHTCVCRWFSKCAVILFLNKKDIFAEKIKHKSIKSLFSSYKGGTEYEDQVSYIKMKYEELNLIPNRVIYKHETCATDTNQIQLILDNVIDMLLRQTLGSYGIY